MLVHIRCTKRMYMRVLQRFIHPVLSSHNPLSWMISA